VGRKAFGSPANFSILLARCRDFIELSIVTSDLFQDHAKSRDRPCLAGEAAIPPSLEASSLAVQNYSLPRFQRLRLIRPNVEQVE
jgi:hypothetical protein